MREMVEKAYSSDPEVNVFCHELLRSVKEMKAGMVGASHSEDSYEQDELKKQTVRNNQSSKSE